jgi:hypothetical protein
MQKEEVRKPILVKNPETGLEINVEPLFRVMGDTAYSRDPISNIVSYLDVGIRHIGMFSEPFVCGKIQQPNDTLTFMYVLRDMFTELAVKGE